MLKTAPNPIDVQDFQFKLKCRLKVFENKDGSKFSQACNLIACASRLGLCFLGTNTSNLQVIQLARIHDYSKSDGDKADYPRRLLALPSPPIHLSVNSEHNILAVVVEKGGCFCCIFYDVKSFWHQNVSIIGEVRLSATPGVHVLETKWNPALGAFFTACKSDGSLGIYEIKNPGIDINELPSASGATCFSWSPKGKQIAVGSRDGKITQYKPDLKAVKVIGPPPLQEPQTLLALQWVSNYQFIGVYQRVNSNEINFIVVDAPKTGENVYLNYYDICYSNGNARPFQFYMLLQQTWNLIMVASSNSMEVGVLGNIGDSWIQWILADAARAELPLTADHQDTLPIGCDIDIGSTKQIPWGEVSLPPAPVLLLLSHYGVLCCFDIINLKGSAPSICSPPEPIHDASGLQHFKTVVDVSSVPKPVITSASQFSNETSALATTPASQPVFKVPEKTSEPSKPTLSAAQSLNLFGGQTTLTPIIKNSNSISEPATSSYQPIFPTQSNEEYQVLSQQQNIPCSSLATTQQLFPTSFVVTSQQKPATATIINIPNVSKSAPSLVTPTSQTFPATVSQVINVRKDETANVNLQAEKETEKLFAQIVKDECIFLESELRALLYEGKTLKLNLGTDEDKNRIVENTHALQEFFKEMTDLCTSQNSEVHILKQNLLQSWVWYEEIKSRHVASQDESMIILMKAQPLDPVSEKRLDDIRYAKCYLESQIVQAHRVLDEQWMNFQDYCKKTYRMQIPTMEMIFQTMVKQTAILSKQAYVLKDISSRIKSKSRSAVGPLLLIPTFDYVKNLPEELKLLQMDPDDIYQIQYQHVLNRKRNFTKKKCDDLRNFLKKREYSYVSTVKPQLSTTVIQSPSSKLKQIPLLLKSKVDTSTNIVNIPKKLEFVPSTPKVCSTADMKSSTPIQGLQNFTMAFGAQNFNKVSPLPSKNVLAGSPNSAFAATGNVPASVTTTAFKPVYFGVSTASTKPAPTFAAPTSFTANQSIITPSSNSLSKPLIGFTTSTKADAFNLAVKDASTSEGSVFGTTSKPSSAIPINFNLGISTKPLTSSDSGKATSTHSVNLAVKTTSSQFHISQPSTSTSIFVSTTQKPSEVSASSKPFSFSSFPSKMSEAAPTTTTQSKILFMTTNTSVPVPVAPSIATTAPPIMSIQPTVSRAPSSSQTQSVFGMFSNSTKSSLFESTSAPSVMGGAVTTNDTINNKPIFTSTPTVIAANLSTSPGSVPTTTKDTRVNVSSPAGSTTSSTVIPPTQPLNFSITNSGAGFTFSGTSPVKTIFGKAYSSSDSTKSSLFGATQTPTSSSAFGVAATTATIDQSTANSVFGSSISTTAPTFGTVTSSSIPAFSSTSTSLFAPAAGSSTSTFGAAVTSTSPIFGAPSSNASSVFCTTTSTTPSVFGSVTPSTSSVFGTQSLFGASISSTSAFGTATTTTGSTFGSAQTSKPSIFGSATVSTASIFGGAPAATPAFGTASTSTASLFGGSATSSAPQSIFGNTAPVATTSQSQGFGIFGSTSPKPSIFGGAATTTQSSTFDGNSQASVFGTTTTATGSTFGQKPQIAFGQSFPATKSTFGTSSVFGNASNTFGQTTGTVFGSPATTSSGTIFGGTPTSGAFGSGSIFGAPPSTSSSPFGTSNAFSANTSFQAANTSASSFGFGNLNVGSSTMTSNSVFASPTNANPFAANDNKNVFGASTPSSSSVFGSGSTSVFGGSPQSQTFGNSNFGSGQSIFGQQSTFGSSSFGQQSPGPFSGGSGTVAQSGFRAATSFQKPAGFGGSTVFGSSPAFGGTPSFGGAPSFGSTSTFGSPTKVFGSTGPNFGAATSLQAAGFGNLANQPTVGFGNLAQQTTNPQTTNAPFSGHSSFSSWR